MKGYVGEVLAIVVLGSMNRCFMRWAQSLVCGGDEGCTVSFDVKTVRSTGKMDGYDSRKNKRQGGNHALAA